MRTHWVPPVALAALAAVQTQSHSRLEAAEDSQTPIHPPSFSERTIGNYENRLRKLSSPERVFEYFSSVEIDKQFFMTREDLARAITPYTYRSGAPLASKNAKYNVKALSAKPSKEIVAEYTRRLKELLVDKQTVISADVQTLLRFQEEQQIDHETHLKALRTLQITNAEFEQFLVVREPEQCSIVYA